MKPVPPHPLAVLLYRTVLLPDRDAAEVWSRAEPQLDLDDPSPPGAEVFGLLSHRLPELGIDYPGLARLHGIRKHNWVSAQVALADVPRGVGDPPILVGRGATVAAYLPGPGTAPISVARSVDRFDGPLVEVSSEGATFRVPGAANHVVWTLERGMWLDAVLTLRCGAPSWESIVEVVASSDRPLRIHQRLSMLDQLGMQPPHWVVDATKPTLLEAAFSRARGRAAAIVRGRPASP